MSKKLTDKQIAAIAIISQPKRAGMTYEQIADEVGVTPRTLYTWRNEERFNKALKNKIMNDTIDRLPEVMASVPDHIIDQGNAAMLRTLLQAHGLLTEKHEVTSANNDSRDIDEMKAELAEFKSRRGENVEKTE
ncbi:helix-turn-helix domain-containing protein [Virgibacillus sp. AGTR]|uniref:phBC6A51 family helix-turn-helix protein n=1 Tax=Virgibacillus sp. AGTR TaxID=2812055 RepID=UPI001D1694F3|nr:phBC6A51 family helix-turn-helix protein [Virgibacillus sp. AGTR]MCC2250379.1 helix-turn-helix domain-containing protein [Virgibacillus sp. AGTR]